MESSESSLYWHYTDAIGLRGILVDHVLRATSVTFLNDPSEQTFVDTAAITAVMAIAHPKDGSDRCRAAESILDWRRANPSPTNELGFSRRFVLCASKAGDSLSLWRGYGARLVAQTFAIGLEPTAPIGCSGLEGGDATSVRSSGWKDIAYVNQREALSRARRELLDRIDAMCGPPRGLLLDRDEGNLWCAYDEVVEELETRLKHKAFEDEKEVRVETRLTGNQLFKVRSGSQGIVPYLELTSVDKWGETAASPRRLKVREVVAGPGANATTLGGIMAAAIAGGYQAVLAGSHDEAFVSDLADGVLVSASRVPFV